MYIPCIQVIVNRKMMMMIMIIIIIMAGNNGSECYALNFAKAILTQ